MRVFVTGASGFIGSAVVPELISAGHEVVGLARSDQAAETVAAAGAKVLRGHLEDLESLRAGATEADAVVHLAYVHDFTDFAQFEAAGVTDRRAVEAMGEVLAGTDRPFAIASGVMGIAPGRLATERELPPEGGLTRHETARYALGLAERGIRSSVVRLSPSVHETDRAGFVSALIGYARGTGVSGYRGDGSNRWAAVHRQDAASLFRLAIEKAPAGSVLHGVGEEGVTHLAIAEVIGRHLGVPVQPVPDEKAEEHFGWFAQMLAADSPASNTLTRELLGWEPTHAGLLDDLETGRYFEAA